MKPNLLKKKIAEGEAKLKQQQNLYEDVRSERNLYSKNLIEAQDDPASPASYWAAGERLVAHLATMHGVTLERDYFVDVD